MSSAPTDFNDMITTHGKTRALAIDCGNLLPVAQALRGQYPDLPIVVCADDDAETEGNPGKSKAMEAAEAVGVAVVLPVFFK